MSIFDSLSQFGSLVSNRINDAFNPQNHGFLDGNFDDFQLGFKRAGGLIPSVISNNIQTISKGVGQGANNILSPLSYNPSFYLIAGGSIIALLIIGYSVVKIGKYI